MAKSAKAKARRTKRRQEAHSEMGANPAMARAMADLRRSGAAGTHQGGVRGQRTRSGAKRAAIAESASY